MRVSGGRTVRRLAAVWLLGAVLACGARPPPVSRQALAAADAELRQGCYACLLAARASYRQMLATAERAQLAIRVFEADLLIALREAELDLPASDALDEARQLARELPPAFEAAHYLTLLDAVPPVTLELSLRELLRHRAAFAPRLPAERAWLARGAARPEVRRYLQRALDCAYATDPGALIALRSAPDAAREPPLIAYRLGSCAPADEAQLAAVRASEPRFVEASLGVARQALDSVAISGPRAAGSPFAELAARFPASPALAYFAARYQEAIGDAAGALALFDRALARRPQFALALLGRVKALATLARTDDAIAAATQLIALAGDTLGEAYYWRARSHYVRTSLADAAADIAAAKRQALAAHVLSLAGIIEHDQGALEEAQADLELATAAASGDCTGWWYLGLVHRARKRWGEAGRTFETTLGCFRDRSQAAAKQAAGVEARADLEPDYRARTAASLRASSTEDARQYHLAALTAATCYAAGNQGAAVPALLAVAAEDAALGERIAKLQAWLAARQAAAPRPARRK